MKSSLITLAFFSSAAMALVNFSSPLAVTATTTSAKALDINNKRKYLLIQNKGAVTVYVSVATQPASQGIQLAAGGSYEPNEAPINEIWVKAASSTADLVIIQGE